MILQHFLFIFVNILGLLNKNQMSFEFIFFLRLKSELKKKQKDNNLPMKNLIGECSTWWGSKYDMVKRIVENQIPLQQTLNGM